MRGGEGEDCWREGEGGRGGGEGRGTDLCRFWDRGNRGMTSGGGGGRALGELGRDTGLEEGKA